MSPFAWAVLAALVWGTAPIIEKLGLAKADPMAALWARSLGVVAGAVALTFAVPQLFAKVGEMGARSFWLVAFAGFLASIVGQIFFYNALKLGDVSRVSPVAGSWPLVAFLLGVLLLGEGLTVKKAAGVLLVIAGAVLLK